MALAALGLILSGPSTTRVDYILSLQNKRKISMGLGTQWLNIYSPGNPQQREG